MKDEATILALRDQRLREAQVLYDAGLYEGSFYLLGYCVELALKARICSKFGVPDLFDLSVSQADKTYSGDILRDIRKSVLTHNLMKLIIFSGLKAQFDDRKASDETMFMLNSLLFSQWSEQVRYFPSGHTDSSSVEKVLKALSDPNGIIKWIATA